MTEIDRGLRTGTKFAIAGMLLVGAMCLAAFPCGATVINGDFSAGLTGWTSVGDVQGVTDAVLGDTNADYSLLFQGVALTPGSYCLDFDFLNGLSSDVPVGTFAFPDTFFASLYFINDLPSFDLNGSVFDGVDALMDLDASGPSNVNGTLSASSLGSEWTHFSYHFTNNYAYVIPTFELFNFNGISSDSQVRLDNVAISECAVVPEPATMTLSAMGLLGLAASRFRKAKSL